MVDDPGAGGPAEVPAEVEAVRRVDGAQRRDPLDPSRCISSAVSSPSSSSSPVCANGATSRCPDEYGNLFRSTKARSPRWTTRLSSTSPAASAQSGQPGCSSAWVTYSRRQGAHSGFGIAGFSQLRSPPADNVDVSSHCGQAHLCRRGRPSARAREHRALSRARRASASSAAPRTGRRRSRSSSRNGRARRPRRPDAGSRRRGRDPPGGQDDATVLVRRLLGLRRRGAADGGARRRRPRLRAQGRALESLVRALDVGRGRRHVHRPGARRRADPLVARPASSA